MVVYGQAAPWGWEDIAEFFPELILDLCAGVDPATTKVAIDAMTAAGVSMTDSKDIELPSFRLRQ